MANPACPMTKARFPYQYKQQNCNRKGHYSVGNLRLPRRDIHTILVDLYSPLLFANI